MKINELNINGKTFAKYAIENKTIHISESKINKLRSDETANRIEMITIIQLLEKQKFTSISYLNLNDF